jgi:hypothetical protein
VVDIESPNGVKASKEYDAPSMRGAVRVLERDLARYPNFRFLSIRPKDSADINPTEADAW